MSNDGNVLVYNGPGAKVPLNYAIWTPQYGFMDAYQFLLDRGVNFEGYDVYNVYSVSADGTKFGGLVWSPGHNNLLPFIATIDPLVPTPKTFSVNASIVGGNNASGALTLSAASKSRFRAVVSSSNHLVSAAPILNANTTVESFQIPTSGVAAATNVSVEATIGGTSLALSVQLLPASLTSMNFAVNSVVGGASVLCAAHFNGNTPTTGGTMSVKSSLPSVAAVNPGYYLAKNSPYSEFAIVTHPVATVQSPVITITYGTVSKSETLTVDPPTLSAIVPGASSVVGGSAANIKVELNGAAPIGGLKVAVKSSSALATVAPTASIPAGAASVVLPVATTAVTKSTVVTFTATYGSVVKTCTLTLTP
jgi:hypothetical protein